jgi:DNA modification methylase
MSRDELDRKLAEALLDSTYDEVSRQFGVSRGRIYAAACRLGARKNEARIQERRREKRERRRQFMAEVMNAVSTSDVLDFLDGIDDESIALHFTSPPYNVGRGYGGGDGDRLRHHFYVGWMLQVCSEMCRTLRPGGVLGLQVGSTRLDSGQMYPLDAVLLEHLRAMGLVFQNRVIWEVQHGLAPKNRLANRYETLLILSKGDSPAVFNPTPLRSPQKQPGKRAFKGPRKGELSGCPLGAWPTDVWRINNVGHNHPERTGHPAQMPSELARRAALLYTRPGDLVCDPFCGSGTTAAEARRTGRAFVGADLFYEDLRAQRLREIAPDTISVLPGISDEMVAVWEADAHRVDVPAQAVNGADLEQLALGLGAG